MVNENLHDWQKFRWLTKLTKFKWSQNEINWENIEEWEDNKRPKLKNTNDDNIRDELKLAQDYYIKWTPIDDYTYLYFFLKIRMLIITQIMTHRDWVCSYANWIITDGVSFWVICNIMKLWNFMLIKLIYVYLLM